jgi:hypothetical protein
MKKALLVGIGIVIGIFIVVCGIVALVGGGHKESKPTLVALAPVTPTAAATRTPSLASSGATEAKPAAAATAVVTPTPVPEPTATPEPTPTPSPELGASRTAPLPVGTYAYYEEGQGMAVLGIERPADQKIQEFNMFNDKPDPGQEWVIVRALYGCRKSESETCSFSSYAFRLVGSKGVIYQYKYAAVPDRYGSEREIFGGSQDIEAYLTYIVDKDDGNFVVIWDPGLGKRAIYFATE